MSVVPTLHLTVRDEAVERIADGTSVDVQGMPGSGRSQLLRAIADELDDGGFRVVRMRGVAALAEHPLEPLAIAGLVDRRDAARATTSIAAAVAGVGAAVRDGRTVIVVDDVDDLDEVTAGVLIAAHAERPFPLLSASTARPRSARSAHPLQVGVQPGVTLPVPALGFIDTQTLLAGVLDGPIDARVVGRIFTASGGLPGLALAIVDGAQRSGALAKAEGVWTADSDMWTPGLSRTLEPFLRPLTPAALEGLHALALAGTVDAATARGLMGWDALEELDGYHLLRFVPQGDDVIVGVFPPVLAEQFARRGVGSRQLKVSERIGAALAGAPSPPPSPPAAPVTTVPVRPGEGTGPVDSWPPASDAGPVVNRMLVQHWSQRAARHRAEWEAHPGPRTAGDLLGTLLVTGADRAVVRDVVDRTPRTGDRRALVGFDAWSALAAGVVDHDLERVRSVLDRSRAEAPQWSALLDAVELHLTLLLDRVPDPDEVDAPGGDMPPAAADAWTVARAEVLLARGRPAEALALLDGPEGDDSAFAHIRADIRGIALVLDGRFDEAMEWASTRLAVARATSDIDGIVAHAYTVALVLLMRMRIAELRVLLASVLSAGVLSALQRPAEVGLISLAATIALESGQPGTARNLAGQALAVGSGTSWYPIASAAFVLARVDGDGSAVDALWAEQRDLALRGCTFAALISGMLAVTERPDAARTSELLALAGEMPAAAARWLEAYLRTLSSDDPEAVLRGADAQMDAGLPYFALHGYRRAIGMLTRHGSVARAASAAAAARARLETIGPEAAAALGRAAAQALTGRELEVARLAADGLSNQQIADRLHLSVRTVENHLHRAFRKLGVDSRAALADALTA